MTKEKHSSRGNLGAWFELLLITLLVNTDCLKIQKKNKCKMAGQTKSNGQKRIDGIEAYILWVQHLEPIVHIKLS